MPDLNCRHCVSQITGLLKGGVIRIEADRTPENLLGKQAASVRRKELEKVQLQSTCPVSYADLSSSLFLYARTHHSVPISITLELSKMGDKGRVKVAPQAASSTAGNATKTGGDSIR